MDRNDKEKIEAMLAEKKAEAKAHMMMLDMLSEIVPDELKPIFELPKLCNKAAERIGDILSIAKDFGTFENGSKYAVEACAFIARVNEAIEAFIEQETPSRSKKPSEFDQM